MLQNLYLPGAIRDLERLEQVKFEHFVPAHFGPGPKDDLVASGQFFKDLLTPLPAPWPSKARH